MLETEVTLIPEIVRCVDFANKHNTLNTNTETAVGVIARFIRDGHSGFQRRVIKC